MYKRNTDLSLLADCYGEVNTNLGTGLVFELCRDSETTISKSIEYYFRNNREESILILDNIELLKKYLIKNLILFTDLTPDNILYKVNENKLMVIDGIGNYDFIKISNYFSSLAINKINRKFDRFKLLLFEMYPDNTFIQKRYS